MTKSKEWDWKQVEDEFWLNPCEESFYYANRWKEKNYNSLLDLGSGLGRHSIYFAKQGFNVSALDLSEYGINHLNEWAKKENLAIKTNVGNILNLPYDDNSFDCIFSYHVISHTDSNGIKTILGEIKRVLKDNGEVFLTLCSKESWSFTKSNYPKIDENTVIKTCEGPENGIPHFYVNLDDILDLFSDFDIIRIRHINDCFFDGQKQNGVHYFINAKVKK